MMDEGLGEWSVFDSERCWDELLDIWSGKEFRGSLRSLRSSEGSPQGEDGWLLIVEPLMDWYRAYMGNGNGDQVKGNP